MGGMVESPTVLLRAINMTTVASFEIQYYQCLNHTGKVVNALPQFARDSHTLLHLYRTMLLTREFDTRAISLQRTGQLGTYASSLGQEAVSVAIGHTMRTEDILVPMYREYGAQIQRGVQISELLLYWGGDERGMAFAKGAHEDFPISVPVASHAPHAVGVAYAFKYRRQPRVCLCVVGDGATSKGDFYEAINAAGAWNLPVVFVVNNNQWAISVPRKRQSKSQTLAQKAIAAGFDAEQVDGNDVICMSDRIGHALDKARNAGGPHLIEALTYRLCDHTTADDASRYRDPVELKKQQRYDPIERLRTYLFNNNYINDDLELRIKTECANQVEEEINRYLNTAPLKPQCMFDYLYESLPEAFEEQREMMAKGDVNDA